MLGRIKCPGRTEAWRRPACPAGVGMTWPDPQPSQADPCLGLTMGRVGEAVPYRFRLRSRTAVLTSALIFVGFWLTGVLSQSPHFRSYSTQVTSLTPRERP